MTSEPLTAKPYPDLSRSQRQAMAYLLDDLARRTDLSEHAKRTLLANRLATYRERNAARTASKFGGSDLERRAAQVRADDARGRIYAHYEADVRSGRAKPPPTTPRAPSPALAPPSPARVTVPARYSLTCIGCEAEIRLASAKPRRPLCARCAAKRAKAKQERRAKSRQSPRSEVRYVS